MTIPPGPLLGEEIAEYRRQGYSKKAIAMAMVKYHSRLKRRPYQAEMTTNRAMTIINSYDIL